MDLSDSIRNTNIDKIACFIDKEKAILLEKAIYDFTIEHCDIYRLNDYLYNEIYESKLMHILNNLDENNDIHNNYLCNAIKNNELDISKIPYMKPHETFPKNWDHIIDKIKNAEEKKKNLNVVESFPCKKCGCKKHTIVQMQTRGADEPMTVFITCQMCGNTVKKG